MAETPPGPSTRDALIEATSRRLWTVDESELRILDICQETNLSTSVIYGHFRSRQGLIDASLLHLFAIVTDQIVDEHLDCGRRAPTRPAPSSTRCTQLLTNPR